MTAALVLDPVRAAAAVNGLLPVLPLRQVTCPNPACEGGIIPAIAFMGPCHVCGGSGTVPQSVPPGTYLVVATGDWLPDSWQSGDWRLLWRHDGVPFLNGPGAMIRLHPGSVVGSVTVTAAPPIYDDGMPRTRKAYLEVSGDRLALWGEVTGPFGPGLVDYSDSLPWLGDPAELVGQTGVLVENAATTEQRCPNCNGDGGFKEDSMILYGIPGGEDWAYPCDACNTDGTCAPFPVSDDLDLIPGTLIELELT